MTSDYQRGLLEFINAQANDAGLWFVAVTAPEAYLQQELRRLHAIAEAGPVPCKHEFDYDYGPRCVKCDIREPKTMDN